jgi:hypothetical protein
MPANCWRRPTLIILAAERELSMRFILEQVRTGGDRNFGYLLGDREAGEGVLIDPSFD